MFGEFKSFYFCILSMLTVEDEDNIKVQRGSRRSAGNIYRFWAYPSSNQLNLIDTGDYVGGITSITHMPKKLKIRPAELLQPV